MDHGKLPMTHLDEFDKSSNSFSQPVPDFDEVSRVFPNFAFVCDDNFDD